MVSATQIELTGMAFVAKRKTWREPGLIEQSRLTSFDIRFPTNKSSAAAPSPAPAGTS
jgi:hypothetical protein